MTEVEYSAFPTSGQVEAELNRVKYKNRYHSVLRSTVFTLLVVAAIAVLIATLWMPVLRIYGESMSPTLTDGSIVVTLKTSSFKEGSIVAFYYNNNVLVKRVIAGPGDWVDIDEDGNVYVNNVFLEESYLPDGAKALGDTNITLPYQVPDDKYFVMGDNRDVSVDSRNTAVGCVSEEQLIGRLAWTVWPFTSFGKIH